MGQCFLSSFFFLNETAITYSVNNPVCQMVGKSATMSGRIHVHTEGFPIVSERYVKQSRDYNLYPGY